MSDTESGIIPKPHEVVTNHDGLIRWRPEYDTLRVDRLAFGERRVVVAGTQGSEITFKLSQDQAIHLAGLLRD